VKTSQTSHSSIAQGTVIFPYSLNLGQQSSATFKQHHVFPHPSSAATGAWRSAVPWHPHVTVSCVFKKKNHKGSENLTVWGRRCNVRVATLSIQIL